MLYLAIFTPLAPILTWLYGVLGLITAFLASSLAFTVYGLSLAHRRFGVGVDLRGQLRIYLTSALSALPTLALLKLSPFPSLLNLVIGIAVYLLAYLTLTPILRSVNEHDLENLKQIFKGVRVLWPIVKLTVNYESKLLALSTSTTHS